MHTRHVASHFLGEGKGIFGGQRTNLGAAVPQPPPIGTCLPHTAHNQSRWNIRTLKPALCTFINFSQHKAKSLLLCITCVYMYDVNMINSLHTQRQSKYIRHANVSSGGGTLDQGGHGPDFPTFQKYKGGTFLFRLPLKQEAWPTPHGKWCTTCWPLETSRHTRTPGGWRYSPLYVLMTTTFCLFCLTNHKKHAISWFWDRKGGVTVNVASMLHLWTSPKHQQLLITNDSSQITNF